MKNSLPLALALIALAVFSGFGLAQERKVSPTQGAQKVGPDEEARRQAAEPVLTPPPMSRDDTAKLEAFRNQARVNACPGSFPVPIAVSVMGANHYSSGQDVGSASCTVRHHKLDGLQCRIDLRLHFAS